LVLNFPKFSLHKVWILGLSGLGWRATYLPLLGFGELDWGRQKGDIN